MPLPSPTINNKNYQQILQEVLARIPAHNPEWSNFNDSDPGITLLQLFAFMSESIIYRTNLIPERNRMKFLKLLGITMRPASVAKGLVQFSSLNPKVLSGNEEVLSGNVPFRTQNGLHVLPIQTKLYYKQAVTDTQQSDDLSTLYQQLYSAIEQDPENLQLYETRVFSTPQTGNLLPIIKLSDTVDASYWLALLADEKSSPDDVRDLIANKTLTLGIMPALGEDGCVLYPLGPAASTDQPSLVFETPQVNAVASTDDNAAQYRQLSVKTEQDPLAAPGVIEVQLPAKEELKYWDDLEPLTAGTGNYPPALENTDDAKRLISWIRIRSPEVIAGTQQSSHQLTVAINWLGGNAAEILQKTHVAREQLPRGTGIPNQIAILRNTPVIPESLQLFVNNKIWLAVDDLNIAAAEVSKRSPRLAIEANIENTPMDQSDSQVYRLDPESGEIYFGDGLHGSRPPQGAAIVAVYDYGGGALGNVSIGEVNKQAGLASLQGVKVSNPVPTWGADDKETLEEAEHRIPAYLRHNERLVSETDYRDITLSTPGIDLARVEVLPLFHPDHIDLNSDGMVSVMVIPKKDPQHPNTPEPDRLFLQNICNHLTPRRIVTTELHVRGPVYQGLVVSVGIDVIPGHAQAPVVNAVKLAIQNFLSPLTGGFESSGWALNTAVEAAELAAAATRVSGVASVVQGNLLLGDEDGNQVPSLSMIGLQLPRLIGISVTVGDPVPLMDILGLSTSTTLFEGDGTLKTPVPIIPEIC